ncbi:hypothetical protein BDR06DRAFT_1005148 [Suillus hirtellus]|nr:hypothetical protein BDR06DRAFT_1005148 [Suillus hirtellus]
MAQNGAPYPGLCEPGNNVGPLKLVTKLYHHAQAHAGQHASLSLHTRTPVAAATHETTHNSSTYTVVTKRGSILWSALSMPRICTPLISLPSSRAQMELYELEDKYWTLVLLSVQPAMDHILETEGKPTPDPSAASPTRTTKAGPGAISNAKTKAKDTKCSECGKVFKNTALANYHVEKSGHDPFEGSAEEIGRIKPLMEEEKQQKSVELRKKIAAKCSVKAQQEAIEARANKAIRFKSGKDINKLRDELKAEEIVKEGEQKCGEKLEDARAKAAVNLARIEADKKVRAERATRENALRDGQLIIDSSDTTGTNGKDFNDTRLQIRMASGGTPYTTTLPSDATAQTLSVDVETVTFAQEKILSRSV